MKYFLTAFLIFSSILFAQTKEIDSTHTAVSSDSVNIKEMVLKQIEAAKEKSSISAAVIVKTPEVKLGVPADAQQSSVEENRIIHVLNNMPLHIKLFLSLSAIILLAIVFRRVLLSFGKKTTTTIKDKIALLREEKVGSKENPKLKASREQLMNSKILFDATDKEISRAAKDLKIAKGEFLLAARLKLFEVGKI